MAAAIEGFATPAAAEGFVLTGGLSSRMGRDKALLEWGGGTLVQHVAGEVQRAVGTVRLAGAPDVYGSLGFAAIADAAPSCGPLGGIVAALRAASRPWALIAACDLPNLDWRKLRELMATAAEDPDADAVVPVDERGRLHPLCAVYHRRTLPTWEAALGNGTLRLQTVLEGLRVRRLLQADSRWLTNVNTPDEWLAAIEETA
jgi:molybdopterin-guanine dinucleotide biosynthesis protein A